jgi:hypothetical protein
MYDRAERDYDRTSVAVAWGDTQGVSPGGRGADENFGYPWYLIANNSDAPNEWHEVTCKRVLWGEGKLCIGFGLWGNLGTQADPPMQPASNPPFGGATWHRMWVDWVSVRHSQPDYPVFGHVTPAEAGVTVRLCDLSDTVLATAETDGSGYYQVYYPDAAPGDYTVKVGKPGYYAETSRQVHYEEASLQEDFTLSPFSVQVSIPLTTPGWHMISLPLEPIDKSLLLDRGSGQVDPESIFYDAYAAGNDPRNRLFRIRPGVGYWTYNPYLYPDESWYEVGVEPPAGKPDPGPWWQGFWFLVVQPHVVTYAAYPPSGAPDARAVSIASASTDWAWMMVGACARIPDPYDPDVTTWPATNAATDMGWGSSPPPTLPASWLPTSTCAGADAWDQSLVGLPLSGYLTGSRYYAVSPSAGQPYCGPPADTADLRPGEGYWLDVEDPALWLLVRSDQWP